MTKLVDKHGVCGGICFELHHCFYKELTKCHKYVHAYAYEHVQPEQLSNQSAMVVEVAKNLKLDFSFNPSFIFLLFLPLKRVRVNHVGLTAFLKNYFKEPSTFTVAYNLLQNKN